MCVSVCACIAKSKWVILTYEFVIYVSYMSMTLYMVLYISSLLSIITEFWKSYGFIRHVHA